MSFGAAEQRQDRRNGGLAGVNTSHCWVLGRKTAGSVRPLPW